MCIRDRDITVVRAFLGIGLTCHGKTSVGDIFISQNAYNAGDFHSRFRMDLPDHGVGMRTSQQFYTETVPGSNVIGVRCV